MMMKKVLSNNTLSLSFSQVKCYWCLLVHPFIQTLRCLCGAHLTDTSKVEPPMPPSEGRFEIVIDNDVIRHLDLTAFHTATGITNPLSGT